MRLRTSTQRGFTLMEMIVVLGLFTVAFTIVTLILFNALKSQRQVSAMQETLAESKVVMELIARNTRLSEIDYRRYANSTVTTQPTHTLWLKRAGDVTNAEVMFTFNEMDSTLDACESPVDSCWSGTKTPTSITSTNIEILDVSFLITPPQAPKTLCQTDADCDLFSNDGVCGPTGYCLRDFISDVSETFYENAQPTVTIMLTARAVSARLGENTPDIHLQTTVASRVYQSTE